MYGAISSFDNTDNILTIKYWSTVEMTWRSYKIYFNEELSSVEYTVYINDAPDGATVTLDGKSVSNGDTYTTAKELSLSSLNASEPEDYYAECSYEDLVFTVNYKEYYHYMVGVTGCEENGAGVKVNGGWQTYYNGEKLNSKVVLSASDLSAATVNGYVADNIEISALTGKNATITVSYSVAPVVPYTVTITGMPEGASVKIEEEVFTESGTHESRMTLSSNDVTIDNCPDTHFTNDRYEWYDEENKAFNIVFSEYLVYTVAVDENGAYTGVDAGVKYNWNTYHATETFKSKTALSVEDVQPAEVDDHTGTVTLADKVFTVSYAKNEFITFDASKFNTGDWGYGTLDQSKDDVRLQAYDNSDNFVVNGQDASHIVLTSSAAPIVKVELEYVSWGKPSSGWYGAVDAYNQGDGISTTNDITTWTGSTKSLELWQSNSTAYVSLIKVWLAKPTTYHVNITGMPAGEDTYVVINNDYDNGKYTTSGNYTYPTFNELNEWSVNLFYPESYKASKTYNAETKTYDVTYTALTQYNVVAGAENAYTEAGNGVRVKTGAGEWDYVNKEIGSTFYFDGTLEESAIEVRPVDGYTGSFVLDNDATPKTITVKYVEKAAETYTVVFDGDVPEGASVTITDAAGDHIVNYADDDKTFQSRYAYTDASAKAKAFEFYDATVALNGTTFTVTYSEVDYIYVDLTTDEADRTKVTNKSTAETVSVNFTAWDGMAEMCSGWPITVTSATYNIAKIEYVYDHGYKNSGTSVSAGAWTTEFEVWEAGSSKTKSVVYDASYSSSDVYYTAVKVYLDTDPVGQFAMSAAGWATLCINDDFILPEDYTAYTVGKLVGSTPVLEEDGQIVFTEIERVPAGTPVIICGPENANVSLLPTYGAVAPEVNYLYGNSSNEAITYYAAGIADQGLGELDFNTMEYTYGSFGPCQLYQLGIEDDLVGFYRQVENGVSLKCGAHKAFLVVPSSIAASNSRFVFPGQEGTLTGINAVATEDAEAIYNLQGQRVNVAKAGVYVKNGRKVIVK